MSCGPISMTAILKLNRPFNGRFYPVSEEKNYEFEIQPDHGHFTGHMNKQTGCYRCLIVWNY